MENEEKIKLIEKTIEKVRPYIQNDGGDVQFVKLGQIIFACFLLP